MATLRDVPIASLLEELSSRLTEGDSLALTGKIKIEGEEHEIGIVFGDAARNYMNLEHLQRDILMEDRLSNIPAQEDFEEELEDDDTNS